MSRIILSVCSRVDKRGSCLTSLLSYQVPGVVSARISWDASSYYSGHKLNIDAVSREDDDIIVMVHDDVEIITRHDSFYEIIELCRKPGVGFVGVAGCTTLQTDPIWWNSRHTNETRGFVFQGKDKATMTPNNFGSYGQVVALDGCFLACTYKTLKDISIEHPKYLTSGWDFYDLHLTTRAHLLGYSNYAVPIIIRHESDGAMRKEWYESKQQFTREHRQNLPLRINKGATNGLPN